MISIGETLRKARESQCRTLAEVALELCVTQAYLSAIEKDDWTDLPGLFFYKSFARQYAAIVGVDEAHIRPQLEALSAAEVPSPHPDIRILDPLVEKTNRRFIPDIPLGWSVAGLTAVVVLCSGFYAWWTRVPEQPRVQVSVSSPAATTVAFPQAAPLAAVEATPVVSSAPDGASEPLSENASGPLTGIVLKLSATERTWLSVSSGGKEIFSGFLQPSESKVLSGLDITTMRVGNAAGIDVHWNGKPIGPLGTRGQVLTIRFTPEDFEILPPNDPPKEQL